ncbi:MAG: CoB--CoM heterodisulfide reductase iron-sulfur subunit A family protein [Chloroflexi bacterium]|nr:CoB--CoM heterodisulfide reductase iron-sulfur subunit A family protein [Chloroflexota bacterium]
MEPRIGVFICDCGGSIKNIDFSQAREKAAKIPDVAFVELSSDLCLKEGEQKMSSSLKAKNIDRVVIAACSPESKKHVFQKALESAGLNGHLLSMVNIREQCSWAHEGDITEKALQMVRMGVNKARSLKPIEKEEISVNKDVLVVGGGFSGMSSAIQLSRLGLRTILLERESALGGKNRDLEDLYGLKTSSLIKEIEGNKDIEVLTSSEVVKVEGKVGDFTVRIRRGTEERSRVFGGIVFATGYETGGDSQLKPGAQITSPNGLAYMLQASNLGGKPRIIGFVFDSSDENSRLASVATLNSALTAKQKWDSEVYVFCKNVKVDGEGLESLYREARECGVVFVKFEEKPKISAQDGRVKIEAKDVLVGEGTALECDLLIAEENFLPSQGTETLSSLLNVRTDSRGFYQEENVHLYPVSSERKGIFFVGDCRGDSAPGRVLTDVSSAVTSLYELLGPGKIVVERDKVKVDPQKCRTCLTCLRACPHSAVGLTRVENGREVAEIWDLACDACGICTALCPAKAIEFEGYSDQQILAQIEAIGVS